MSGDLLEGIGEHQEQEKTPVNEDDGGIPAEHRERAVSVLLGFCALNQACRLYDMNNEVVRKVIADMLENVQGLSGGETPVYLTTAGHSFFLNRELVQMGYTEYQKARQLKEIWGRLGITEVVFPADLTSEGLVEFATMVIRALKDPDQVPELTRRPWGGVVARMVLGGSSEEASDESDDLVCELAVRVYCGLMVLVIETLDHFQQDRWDTLLRIKRTMQVLVDKLEHHEGTLVALTCSAVYRETLAAHLTNTAILTLIMGRKLNLGRRDLVSLATAALFHDVSKVNLKAKTLNTIEQVGQLQGDDRQRIQMHWMNTLNQMVQVGGFSEEALPRLVVGFESQLEFTHGRLYPEQMGLSHPHSFYSHLISLCDRYDNMLWGRGDKPAATPHRAMLSMLANFAKQYHPSLLDLFVRTIGLYPTGSTVRLSSDELAVVTSQDPAGDLERPVVTLISEPDGSALSDHTELNLAADQTRSIKLSEDAGQLGINPISIFLNRDERLRSGSAIGRLALARKKMARKEQNGQ